jgi:hypothetical protein
MINRFERYPCLNCPYCHGSLNNFAFSKAMHPAIRLINDEYLGLILLRVRVEFSLFFPLKPLLDVTIFILMSDPLHVAPIEPQTICLAVFARDKSSRVECTDCCTPHSHNCHRPYQVTIASDEGACKLMTLLRRSSCST